MNKKINYAVLFIAVLVCISGVYASLSDASVIAISLLNQNPSPARMGETVDVRLSIQNIGGKSAENLVVEVIPEYPFTLVEGENPVQFVGTLQGYQGSYNTNEAAIIKYTILVNKDSTAGSYPLKIKYYENQSNAPLEKTVYVDVKGKESAEIIHIDKTILIPGQQSSLKFVVNNVGNSPLRDLTFSWDNDDDVVLPVGSDNTRYVKYIDIGGSAELDYQVIADTNADAGLYPLNLYLTYADSANNSAPKKITTTAGVYVGGGTDFDVAFSESSSGTMSFTIANVGSNGATSVSVIVPEQTNWKVTGANSMIIGNLNAGDYTVASFTLQSTQSISSAASSTTPPQMQRNQNITMPSGTSAQNKNILKLEIAYTDTMGTRNIVEKNITINQASSSTSTTASATGTVPAYGNFPGARQQSFFSKYKWYIAAFIVFIILVVFGILFQKYRKEKVLNPKFNFKDLFRKK